MSKPNFKPQGYHTITPYMTVHDAPKLIEFLKQVFGAVPGERHDRPDGKIMHAEIKIGDSMVMISDACEAMGPAPSHLYFYLEDVDTVFAKAIAASCTEIMPVADQFWGDRMGGVKDPWGNLYWISTHVEDVSPEEIEKRAAAFAASMKSNT